MEKEKTTIILHHKKSHRSQPLRPSSSGKRLGWGCRRFQLQVLVGSKKRGSPIKKWEPHWSWILNIVGEKGARNFWLRFRKWKIFLLQALSRNAAREPKAWVYPNASKVNWYSYTVLASIHLQINMMLLKKKIAMIILSLQGILFGATINLNQQEPEAYLLHYLKLLYSLNYLAKISRCLARNWFSFLAFRINITSSSK